MPWSFRIVILQGRISLKAKVAEEVQRTSSGSKAYQWSQEGDSHSRSAGKVCQMSKFMKENIILIIILRRYKYWMIPHILARESGYDATVQVI